MCINYSFATLQTELSSHNVTSTDLLQKILLSLQDAVVSPQWQVCSFSVFDSDEKGDITSLKAFVFTHITKIFVHTVPSDCVLVFYVPTALANKNFSMLFHSECCCKLFFFLDILL